MMRVSAGAIAAGLGGAPIMRFTLTYSGELKAKRNNLEGKWRIREQIHPQMQRLWRINPSLDNVLKRRRFIPYGGWVEAEHHHSTQPSNPQHPANPSEYIDLCAPIGVGNRTFLPLVRDTFALRCGLKVLFLRHEEPGGIYQGGDMDNRIKTLLDALSVPNRDQLRGHSLEDDPIYCLLENDRLVTQMEVDTHQLLSASDGRKHDVHLVIQVTVGVTQSRAYNQPFLGD